MRIEYRRCVAEHLRFIEVQDAQKEEHAAMIATEYAEIACQDIALSAWLGNRCLGAAGVVPLFPHRFIAWSLVSRHIGGAMVDVTRKIRRVLADHPAKRIEMTVDVDFDAGHRWAILVGMKLETPEPLRAYGARGEDEMMYARIRD